VGTIAWPNTVDFTDVPDGARAYAQPEQRDVCTVTVRRRRPMEEDTTAQEEALEGNQVAETEQGDELGDGFLYAQGNRGER
jgi:hypothetical protein